MRVLVIPNESMSSYGRSAHFAVLYEIMERFSDCALPVWFDVLIPDDESCSIEPLPNCRFVPAPIGATRMVDEIAPTTALYAMVNIRKSSLLFDAVLNQRDLMAPALKRIVKAKTMMMNVDVPIFNAVPMVRSVEACRTGELTFYGDDDLLLGAMAPFMDYAIVLNEHEKALLFEAVRQWVAPSRVASFDDRVYVANVMGIDYDRLFRGVAAGRGRPGDERPVVFYGGRFNIGQKRFDRVLEVMRRVRAVAGDSLRFVCCTPEHESSVQIPDFVDVRLDTDMDEYYALIGESTVSIYCAVAGGIGVCNMSAVFGGSISVIMDADWVRWHMPDYPLVVGSIDEAAEVVLAICADPEAAAACVADFKDRSLALYRDEERTRGLYQWMVDKVIPCSIGDPGSLGCLALRAYDSLSAGGDVSAAELFAKMTEMSDSGRVFGRPGDIMNPFYVRRQLLEAGFRDRCDGSEPKYYLEE